MDKLLLLGFVQATFLGLILSLQQKKSFAEKFLMIWMFFLGFHLFGAYLGASGFYQQHPELFGIDAAFPMIQGPMLYIYVLLATGRERIFKSKFLFHFIPYCVLTALLLFKIHTFTGDDLYEYILSEVLNESDITINTIGILNHLYLVIYSLLSIRILQTYTRNLDNSYSYKEGIDLAWLRIVVIGLGAISLIVVIGLLLSDVLLIFSLQIKTELIYGSLAILPFYLSFFAIQRKIIYPNKNYDSGKYEESRLLADDSKLLATKLIEYMQSEKPFLDGKLSISDLAFKMNMHSKNLSQVINENFDQNFFNFVNSFRVEEAKKRLTDPANKNLKIIAIGLDCGFNTKSSFNSIFKKFTGLTPSSYRLKSESGS